MATEVQKQLYPFSTDQGSHIPADIVMPLGLKVIEVTADAAQAIVIPVSYSIVSIWCTIDALLDFSNTAVFPVVAGEFTSSVVLQADTIYTMALPSQGDARVVPLYSAESGWLYLQNVQKWAALGLRRQLTNR